MTAGFFSRQQANVHAHRRVPFWKAAAVTVAVGGMIALSLAPNPAFSQDGGRKPDKDGKEVPGLVSDSTLARQIEKQYLDVLRERGVIKIPRVTCLVGVPMPTDLSKNLAVELPGEAAITILAEDLQLLAKRKDMSLTGSDKAYYLFNGVLYVLKKDYKEYAMPSSPSLQ
ncbi:MAG: hypothetical protein WC717_01155 [Candidatus Micrarchaeia archaeon]|jgi:hypothetical protein